MATTSTLDTSQITHWRSIITLIVFVLTNVVVLFPSHVPIPVPVAVCTAVTKTLSACRIIPSRDRNSEGKRLKWFRFPVDFVTAPLIADLFLLAILAIGRKEVHDGTVGADHINPIDIMVFFLTLAYIAISIDASGLIKYMAFWVLQKGGSHGRRLFLYLYLLFGTLGGLVGNDPVILSGTPFLAYMTRVSSNIKKPTAWIYTQFAVANVASAILVSSNPTNLVLAGAFQIKFIVYTANVIVPVLITMILLYPFLAYVIFRNEELVPAAIKLHTLPAGAQDQPPVNPNIPNANGGAGHSDEHDQTLQLQEIMNPYLDKNSAAFGTVVIAATLITILAVNASLGTDSEIPVYWVTLPAAAVMFCWDLTFGWLRREETRKIARDGFRDDERARVEREMEKAEKTRAEPGSGGLADLHDNEQRHPDEATPVPSRRQFSSSSTAPQSSPGDKGTAQDDVDNEKLRESGPAPAALAIPETRTTLVSLLADTWRWSRETFPTVTAVLSLLPWKLVPFALCMFVLVQGLVTKGWVPVFAYGWNHWVHRTGTVGAVFAMGSLAVVLCNFAGTNIGTTILLCRIIQAWVEIHNQSGVPISQRTFWATVYSMAIGVNYGAFSTAFSASLAGLLWRDILERKGISVRGSSFPWVNLPIITFAMIVGSAVLVGEVYIMRSETKPYV